MVISSKLISSQLIWGGEKVTKIEKFRKEAKITQAELAVQLGVTQSAISQWESGTTLPEVGKLVKMSKLFGCTVDDLLVKEGRNG